MKLTLVASLVFFVGFWLTSVLIFFSKMSLDPASVAAYYLGSETNFTQPRTYGSMLEVAHGHLPVMALTALLLTHLFIFTPLSMTIKFATIATFFSAALLSELSSWLVRFFHPAFAWLKIAAFLSLEVSMAFVIYWLFKLLLVLPESGETKR